MKQTLISQSTRQDPANLARGSAITSFKRAVVLFSVFAAAYTGAIVLDPLDLCSKVKKAEAKVVTMEKQLKQAEENVIIAKHDTKKVLGLINDGKVPLTEGEKFLVSATATIQNGSSERALDNAKAVLSNATREKWSFAVIAFSLYNAIAVCLSFLAFAGYERLPRRKMPGAIQNTAGETS